MPATRKQVREAWAAVVDGVSDITGHAYTPDTVHSDAVVVTEVDVRFDSTMQRGSDDMTILARALTAGDMHSAQDRLDQIVSDIKAQIEADDTLGGVVHYARVSRIRGDSEGQLPLAGKHFAVVDFETEVVA